MEEEVSNYIEFNYLSKGEKINIRIIYNISNITLEEVLESFKKEISRIETFQKTKQ